jgi:Rab5 GDP/GTP exchange factor
MRNGLVDPEPPPGRPESTTNNHSTSRGPPVRGLSILSAMQPSSSASPSEDRYDPSPDQLSSLGPPSPPPKPASPIHSRDASLQQILRQFDPLSPDRQSPQNKDKAPAPPPKDSPPPSPLREKSRRESLGLTRRASILAGEKPPPAEPDQPFEFHRFLEQMRHKSADGVARYMKR